MVKLGFDEEHLNWDKRKLLLNKERGLNIHRSMYMRFWGLIKENSR
jgi:hypothetical protein